MKIAFLTITFNADFFLKELIDTYYPHAHCWVFVDNAVTYWNKRGYSGSKDGTRRIIKDHPDPDGKITLLQGVFKEKTEACRGGFDLIPDDVDYVWCVDADEFLFEADIKALKEYLNKKQPSSVSFKSKSFFGGFDHIIGGFERKANFKRVLKYQKGCKYVSHRPPTLALDGHKIPGQDISGDQLSAETGIEMMHYSYVSPKGVREKYQYYRDAVIKKGDAIENWYEDIFLQWCMFPQDRPRIEALYNGVHEFAPHARGSANTEPYKGPHPKQIQMNLELLNLKFNNQLKMYS